MKEIIFMKVLQQLLSNKFSRKYLLKKLDNYIYTSFVENDDKTIHKAKVRKYQFMASLLRCALQNVEKGYLSRNVFKRISQLMLTNSYPRKQRYSKKLEEFKTRYGKYPPNFIVLSPTKACNLNCTGCYASSDPHSGAKLPYHMVDRIISEVHDTFHSNFVVISGGEPFLYKSEGKTLLDIFEEYNDMFFLMYTNGTLITPEIAKKLESLGNVTPAVSVEGFEADTDERRGKGTHKKIMESLENLRNAGVPFGISVTATSKNADTLLEDEFYDYFFNRQGATYMWQFQLMPIGRSSNAFDLMVPPEKRLKLYRKWEECITQKKYSVADFWNSGVLSNGCIAYGRRGGYFYIDWNGNIMPCVFVPYYVDNVYELYNNGKSLVDALFSDLMKNGRAWQSKMGHGYAHPDHPDNWLMPCSIRDHYDNFRRNILTETAAGESEEAEEARNDEEYYRKLVEYDQELEKLTGDIWEQEYMQYEKEEAGK
ncbi:MAG: radical SAM protein [Bacteroidales bacterium]|nr:radical SAM protein [Bacteroidales bacterium]